MIVADRVGVSRDAGTGRPVLRVVLFFKGSSLKLLGERLLRRVYWSMSVVSMWVSLGFQGNKSYRCTLNVYWVIF